MSNDDPEKYQIHQMRYFTLISLSLSVFYIIMKWNREMCIEWANMRITYICKIKQVLAKNDIRQIKKIIIMITWWSEMKFKLHFEILEQHFFQSLANKICGNKFIFIPRWFRTDMTLVLKRVRYSYKLLSWNLNSH